MILTSRGDASCNFMILQEQRNGLVCPVPFLSFYNIWFVGVFGSAQPHCIYLNKYIHLWEVRFPASKTSYLPICSSEKRTSHPSKHMIIDHCQLAKSFWRGFNCLASAVSSFRLRSTIHNSTQQNFFFLQRKCLHCSLLDSMVAGEIFFLDKCQNCCRHYSPQVQTVARKSQPSKAGFTITQITSAIHRRCTRGKAWPSLDCYFAVLMTQLLPPPPKYRMLKESWKWWKPCVSIFRLVHHSCWRLQSIIGPLVRDFESAPPAAHRESWTKLNSRSEASVH